MIRYVAIAAFAFLSAGAVAAADPQAQEASGEEAKEEKKVCKTQAVTGNRARRVKTCMTQRQWEAFASGSRRGAEEYIHDVQTRTPLTPP